MRDKSNANSKPKPKSNKNPRSQHFIGGQVESSVEGISRMKPITGNGKKEGNGE
jgi:hypothetical protein